MRMRKESLSKMKFHHPLCGSLRKPPRLSAVKKIAGFTGSFYVNEKIVVLNHSD
jgi:hypothetical protein